MSKNQSGRGDESGGTPDIILDCLELLQAARDNLAALQSLSQKYNFQLVKFASNLNDWMELNDIHASRQISLKGTRLPEVGFREGRQRADIGERDTAQNALASRSQKAPGAKKTP